MKTTITANQLSQLRELVKETDRPYIGLSDSQLLDEIEDQKTIVNDCIQFSKKVAADEQPDSIEKLEGLYFSFLRFEQLTEEMAERFYEYGKQLKGNEAADVS